jgi:hypothetical protein
MYVLSIDVGIKNLAYCLFYIQNNTKYEITDWNVLNLIDDELICCFTKNEKHCKHKAKYSKNDKHYCKIHAKKQDYKIPTNDLDINKLKRMSLSNLCKTLDQYDIKYTKPTTKTNLLICAESQIQESFFNMIHFKNSKEFNLITLGRNLQNKLNALLDGYSLDCVLIENQVSPIASRMKTLQGMIAQYFIMKNVNNIEFISATNKLKLFSDKKKTTYKERKLLGIQYTKKIISETPELNNFVDILTTNKKTDDLADAFLQGLYYLNSNKLIHLNT